jgi:hypothetical protein
MMSTHPPSPISHQTVRLAPGRHAAPEEGVCVMELASMLADEPFTDHPRSVCRVIASFLRAYNDAVDDTRREDLYLCAAIAVGTRDSRRTERARLARCDRELAEMRGSPAGGWRRLAVTAWRTVSPCPYASPLLDELARALSATYDGHRRALALFADLVDLHVAPPSPCRAMSGRPDRTARPGRLGRSGATWSTASR